MRKLASIQIIKSLEPVANSDTLDKAVVLGWNCVVKRGQFNVGDNVVYIEIDSILPQWPEFSFLEKNHYRIKTIRLRGQISQGLLMPMTILSGRKFPNDTRLFPVYDFIEGDNVTEMLEITQWQPVIPADLAGEMKGKFPSWLVKSDETRVQVLQNVLDRYVGTPMYNSEKIDGCSATYYLRDDDFGCCSRNIDLKESTSNAFWQMAREMKIEEKLKSVGKNIAIQGELFGNGIQGNPLKIIGRKILFFNAFDIDKFKYYDFKDFIELMYKLELETVPVLETGYLLTNNIEELVKLSIGKSKLNPKVWREGIVIRPMTEIMDMEMANGFGNGRLSMKVVNPNFLLEVEQ